MKQIEPAVIVFALVLTFLWGLEVGVRSERSRHAAAALTVVCKGA